MIFSDRNSYVSWIYIWIRVYQGSRCLLAREVGNWKQMSVFHESLYHLVKGHITDIYLWYPLEHILLPGYATCFIIQQIHSSMIVHNVDLWQCIGRQQESIINKLGAWTYILCYQWSTNFVFYRILYRRERRTDKWPGEGKFTCGEPSKLGWLGTSAFKFEQTWTWHTWSSMTYITSWAIMCRDWTSVRLLFWTAGPESASRWCRLDEKLRAAVPATTAQLLLWLTVKVS